MWSVDMLTKLSRKIKAALLIAMLLGTEASQTQWDARLYIGLKLKAAAANVSSSVRPEAMTAGRPSFSKLISGTTTNPCSEAQPGALTVKMQALIADPSLREHAKLDVWHMHEITMDSTFKKHESGFMDFVETGNSVSTLQQQAMRAIEVIDVHCGCRHVAKCIGPNVIHSRASFRALVQYRRHSDSKSGDINGNLINSLIDQVVDASLDQTLKVPRRIRNLICLCAALGIAMVMENTFTLFVDSLCRVLHVGEPEVNVAYTVFIVADALSGPLMAKLSDRHGVRMCIICAAMLNALMTAMLSTSLSLPMLYISYALGGLVAAAAFTPCITAAVQLMPPSKQGAASAAGSLCIVAVPAALSSPINAILSHFGPHIAYLIHGTFTTSVFIFSALFFAPTTKKGEIDHLDRQAGLIHDRPAAGRRSRLVMLYFSYLAGISAYYFMEAQVQRIFDSSLPQSSKVLTYGLAVCLASSGCARICWCALVQKCSASVCMAAGMAFCVATMNLWAIAGRSSVFQMVCGAATSAGLTVIWPLMPVLIARIFKPSEATSVYALINTAGIMAAAVAGPVAALGASSFGWPWTLRIYSAIPAIAMLLLLAGPLRDSHVAVRSAESFELPRLSLGYGFGAFQNHSNIDGKIA